MKRLKKLTAGVSLGFMVLGNVFNAAAAEPTTMPSNMITQTLYATTTVNVRKSPSTESDVVGSLSMNESIDRLLGELEFEGWVTVYYNDTICYVYEDYLSVEMIEATAAYSDDDLYIMAHVICGEGQGLPDEEQRLIGSVVLNRVNSPDWPDTIKDVVFQKGQYVCTRDGNYDREPTDRNWENAKWLLENGSQLPEGVVYQLNKGVSGNGVYLETKYHTYSYKFYR